MKNEWGTPELTRKWLKLTPGQHPKKTKTFKEFVDIEMCDTLAPYMDNTIDLSDPSEDELMAEVEDFHNSLTDEDWEEISQEYEIEEDVLIEKGLTPMGRIKKRFSAIRSRHKRKLYKNIAMNRSASPERIQKRAKLAARRMIYKRVLRGRARTTLSPSEKSRVETLLKRAPFQAFITRQTIRIRPNLRRMEMKRIANRRMRRKK
jgi:hypothetical protein